MATYTYPIPPGSNYTNTLSLPGAEPDTIIGDGTVANSSVTVGITAGGENLTITNAYVTLNQTVGAESFTLNNAGLIITASATPQNVVFGTGTSYLQLSVADYTNYGLNGLTITGMTTGDGILAPPGYFISGVTNNGNGTINFSITPNGQTAGGSATHTIYNVSVTGVGGATLPSNALQLNTDGSILSDGPYVGPVGCYVRGTRILTSEGEIAVEDLTPGMLARTASGALRPVTWTGHRRMNVASHPQPETVYPILISRGAFGEGLPVRDLYVSPDHSLFIDGVLIPARLLINGVTVQQARRESVEYWHVELESHDIILAEGLPAESYLDTANRAAFVENGAFCQLHPDFAPKSWDDACAPLVQDGPKLAAARAMLKDRAAALGFAVTHEFDVHVLADGARIEALRLPASRFVFMLPEGAREIALASRDFIPAHMSAASTDGRRLGICVKQLQLDGAPVALDDARLFGEGWQKLETDSDGSHKRWTNGAASLPAGTRLVVVDILYGGQYWMVREQPAQPKLSVVA